MPGALNSMTGFGSKRGDAAWGSWSVEAKSVNGKGLDVRVSTPSGFDALERFAKAEAGKRFHRGNIQLAIRIEPGEQGSTALVNEALLDQLMDIARRSTTAPQEPLGSEAIAALMTVRGVVDVSSVDLRTLAKDSSILNTLQQDIAQALDELKEARQVEGDAQLELFLGLLKEFREVLTTTKAAAASHPERLKARLEAQLAELLTDSPIDADRLAAEVALSAAKADVREELDRLDAHIEQAQTLINSGLPVGRKLEFLSQEIGREANTLCSKSASLELTNAGLALKALNDQFKEQAANVE
ncbi:MAG: YicC/YloC family endoribonuclease [Pseudomonadota bacterium]